MYEYGTYHLKAINGRPIRRAVYVKDLISGEVVRFTEMLGKKRAYAQAYEIFKIRERRDEG